MLSRHFRLLKIGHFNAQITVYVTPITSALLFSRWFPKSYHLSIPFFYFFFFTEPHCHRCGRCVFQSARATWRVPARFGSRRDCAGRAIVVNKRGASRQSQCVVHLAPVLGSAGPAFVIRARPRHHRVATTRHRGARRIGAPIVKWCVLRTPAVAVHSRNFLSTATCRKAHTVVVRVQSASPAAIVLALGNPRDCGSAPRRETDHSRHRPATRACLRTAGGGGGQVAGWAERRGAAAGRPARARVASEERASGTPPHYAGGSRITSQLKPILFSNI